MDALDGAFTAAKLRVSRNEPYKGGYITDHYGRMEGVEALQIEMCQRVYMDEDAPADAPGQPRFEQARAMLHGVFEKLATAIDAQVS